jgi:hypothetical protein
MSRQGNPFIRPCPRDASCRFGESRLSGCGRSRHSFRAIGPAAPDLVRRLAAAQVPLADNNARKLPMGAALRQESPRLVYRNGHDGDHKMLNV